MDYTIRLIVVGNTKGNLIHQTNDYEQAEHFFWIVINKLKDSIEDWQLTLEVKDWDGSIRDKYHCVKK